ncbi:hypothetical protein BDW42DRAFT_199218 [Aspergillus taichungensis]|uniref:Uncharacterized protein n=1 Tax=Aspergillus taichungensis TaxID=482145 RepID=A0A2J5I4C3_9EURO|nr:hypothetical protein BDW42DRAFT_199218 [Aspergillus taichungensis]
MSGSAAKYTLGLHRGPLPPPNATGDDLEALEHVETAKTITLEKIQRTPTQKLARHWKRFWCCYLFWNVIFLAIFLPIFFLICIPAISQRVLDDSDLVLVNAQVMQPRPDSVMLSLQSALKLPIGVPVRIEPITLELFNRRNPGNNTWAKAYLPSAIVHGNTTMGVTNQLTPLDAKQWMDYVHSVVFEKHAPLSVRGGTNSFLGKLKSYVVMNKDIEQNTLDKFAGFAIEDSTLVLPPKEDGTNLIANATLPNPSVLTLEIGNTILDLKSGDLVLGNATIDNLVLKPGNHSNPVRGILDLKTMISNLGDILKEQAPSLRNGVLSLKTVGKSVEYEGVQVPYYTEVMKSLVLTADVPVGALLGNTLKGLIGPNGSLGDLIGKDGGKDGGGLLSSLFGGDGGDGGQAVKDAIEDATVDRDSSDRLSDRC